MESNDIQKEQERMYAKGVKQDMRSKALQAALQMQPPNHHVQTGLSKEGKSVTSLISDCDKIYDWLIKDL